MTAPAKQNHAEHGLSHWVDSLCERILLPMGPCWFTAVEVGEWMPNATPEQRMNRENKRRARGIKPGHLDWYAWQKSTGIYVQFELKVEGRATRPVQDDTIALLKRNKIPTGVFETVPDVCEFLIASGFEVHGNARGIATELHERYLAMRRAAPSKKTSTSRRKVTTKWTVKQGHKMGAWS